MEIIQQLLGNHIFIAGACGWLSAQVLKTIIYGITNKGIDWSRLFGDGGMPSGHSATVTAIAVSCGLQEGFNSPIFAVAGFLAIIVMHDAMGVRLETGKQAKVLNELMGNFYDKQLSPEERLKEFVGHTPLQVVFGSILGLVIAILLG